MTNQVTLKQYFSQDIVKKKFFELLGERSTSFITSVLQVTSSNEMLSKADPSSVFNSAAMAAVLNLPINAALGFAYIVPYNIKQKNGTTKVVAQFQLGYKGYIQLAQRTNQFEKINACEIYEGQLKEYNPLNGHVFDFKNKLSDTVIGYASYFKLTTGFESTLYLTNEEIKKHGERFSQTFKKGYGLWHDDFKSMAKKTVIKLNLSKYAPLSVDLPQIQKAIIADSSQVLNPDTLEVTYIDNTKELHAETTEDKESERLLKLIDDCITVEALEQLSEFVVEGSIRDAYELKLNSLL